MQISVADPFVLCFNSTTDLQVTSVFVAVHPLTMQYIMCFISISNFLRRLLRYENTKCISCINDFYVCSCRVLISQNAAENILRIFQQQLRAHHTKCCHNIHALLHASVSSFTSLPLLCTLL
jgi:hypothetical protein